MAELLGWGAGGVQAFQAFDQQAQLFQQTKQENALKIEEEGLTVQKSKMELQQQTKLMGLLDQQAKQKQMAPGGSAPIVDPTQEQVNTLSGYGDLYAQAGFPEKAKELYTSASTIANQHSEITSRAAANDKQKWETVASLTEGVTDQTGWQQAQLVFQQTHPDWANTPETQKIFKQPFSAQLIASIQKTAHSQLESADLKQKQASAVQATAASKQDEARARLDDIQAENYRSLIDNRNKAGGKNLTPKSSDIKVITDLMKEDYGDPADLEENSRFNNRAVGVAERMLDLKRQGVPLSQASTQAYAEAKQRGTFGGLRRAKESPGDFQRPMAMPTTSAELKDNMYYLGKQGQVARWDAKSKKFILPQVERPAVDPGEEPDDDSNPDDDLPAVER